MKTTVEEIAEQLKPYLFKQKRIIKEIEKRAFVEEIEADNKMRVDAFNEKVELSEKRHRNRMEELDRKIDQLTKKRRDRKKI